MPVRHPHGPGETLAVAFAATVAATIRDGYTRLNITGTANGNFTLNLTNQELRLGDILEVVFTSDGTARVMTPGSGFAANQPTVTGTASDAHKAVYRFNGTAFDFVSAVTN